MPITPEDIAAKQAEIAQRMQDGFKTLDEKVHENTVLALQLQEEIKELRRENIGPGRPTTDAEDRFLNQRNGIFDDRIKTPYSKAISMSANNTSMLSRDRERLKDLHLQHDACVFKYWAMKRQYPHMSQSEIQAKMAHLPDLQRYAATLEDLGYFRANEILNPAGCTGVNLEFTLLSGELIDLVEVEAVVGSQFPRRTLTRSKQEFPALRAHAKSVLGSGLSSYAVPATAPGSIQGAPQLTMVVQPTYGQIAFSCIHNLGAIMWNDDMLEDSVIDIAAALRTEASVMIARGRDSAIINGVKSGTTHLDDDTQAGAAYLIEKAWHGLRFMGHDQCRVDINGAITSPNFATLMAPMSQYAQRVGDLVMLIHVKDWLKLASDADLKTVQNVGLDMAQLRNGVVQQAYGISIVTSEFIRRDLAEDGTYDAVTTNNTIEILFNRTRFWSGVIHEARIEEVRIPQALSNWIQVDVREDFQALDIDAGANDFPSNVAPLAIGRNVTI